MITRWIKSRLEHRTAKDDLHNAFKADHSVADGFTPLDIWQGVTKLSPQTAVGLRKFLNERTEEHDTLAFDALHVLSKYADADSRINIVMRHLDHAIDLGWKYTTIAIPMILEAIDEKRGYYQNFTQEQETALLLLEDSKWNKKYTTNGGSRWRLYSCHQSVAEVALERPQDIDRIISVARQHDPQHAAHLIAILDGEITSPLGDGAL